MCGLAGYIELGRNHAADEAAVRLMTSALRHRGPDDEGYWVEAGESIALGHRRLSIVDLSPHGHQPMISECGQFVIAFNGEIYNYLEIRRELEKVAGNVAWRGHSDTEVMLAAIRQWGPNAAIKKFVGMFAFALWDRHKKVLHLARDRLGEKPLYYGWMSDFLLFGSELKALRAHPTWRGEINRDVLALFLRHNYIPAPYSIYENVHKLLPGTMASISAAQLREMGKMPRPGPLKAWTYWSAQEVAERGVAEPFTGPDSEAVTQLEAVLKHSVKQQMVADVPLGAFLSGGIDSSTVVALMQAQSQRPVKTFSIGFNEDQYNEAEYAKAVACHLGTDHTELCVTPQQAMAVIPKLPTLYDEPFSDSSQIPTFLVSELARQHVTVSLSGDGGDELFAGYNRYFWGRDIWRRIGWMPVGARHALARCLTALSPQGWEVLFGRLGGFFPALIKQRNPGDKLHKLAKILVVDCPETMYLGLVSHWKTPSAVVVGATEPPTILTDRSQWANLPEFTRQMMYLDTVTYLPDDILVKVDRASMGVSLESRVPFLDHRVVEFAWRVPLSMKIRNGQGKWLLRQLLYKYVPKQLIERPKMGFGVPIDTWLRGPLRDWAEHLLDEKRLREEGYLDPPPIREKWQEHLSGKRNWQYYLWDVLMFQAWLEALCT